jgi:hypothetical protein
VLIRQRTEFSVYSDTVPAVEMTARIGLDANRVLVRGSRRQEPPVPRAHLWQVSDHQPGSVGDQAERLLARLAPHRDRLVALSREPDFSIGLMIVRYFADEDGAPNGFGWHLPPELVAFLAAVGASIDVDEYDYSEDEEDDQADVSA